MPFGIPILGVSSLLVAVQLLQFFLSALRNNLIGGEGCAPGIG